MKSIELFRGKSIFNLIWNLKHIFSDKIVRDMFFKCIFV
ncbi:hypothetical protein HMPREF1141_0560 [Clostridium sp. MSTE9]|nr:hypothetical protein HMPREF1141_0560 [Clostridium sp. MSTE9]